MDSENVVSIQSKALAECRDKLEKILVISEAILEAAEEGDWELALARQRFRSTELTAFYAQGDDLPQEVAEMIASGIRKILAIDSKVTDLACKGKASLQEEAVIKQRKGLAAKSYLNQNP